jgi:thioredoxin reductase (NADPH)
MLDLAIIGGGPAGLTAGLYSTRGGLKNVVMYEKGLPGGQITSSSEVENYPGITKVVTGMELMQDWPEQAKRFGLKYEMKDVKQITQNSDNTFKIHFLDGSDRLAKSVIIATGSVPRKANFEGESDFFGKGVSTCATCDGFFYKNKEVIVLGGGDTALEEALYLANICSKVYLVHRRDNFRASPITVERIKNTENIELLLNSKIEKVYGEPIAGLKGAIIKNIITNKEINLNITGVFVFVGRDVKNNILKQDNGDFLCAVNDKGEIIVDLNMNTSIDGLFAAGDLRVNAPKQVVCAASDGAIAALQTISYLEQMED